MKLDERAIRAGYRINCYDTLASTNDEALRRAHAGDRGRLWIVAAQQTVGRGRQGRSWSSPPGNVYASLLLVDPAPPAVAPQLGLVAGVALRDALATCAGADDLIRIKWPNDIVHQGAKLAGILVEGVRCRDGRFACVLGFGVNRVSHPSDLPYAATDLFAMSDRRPTLDALITALSSAVDAVLTTWDRGRGFEAVRRRWLAAALPAGTPMTVGTGSGRADGEFHTMDAQGRLVLTTPDGDKVIEAGDVFLMDQPVRVTG